MKAKALGKLFGIRPGDPDYYRPPARHREDIFRSRSSTGGFSEKRHPEFVAFCKSTGLRRGGMQSVRGRDLYTYSELAEMRDGLLLLPPPKRTEADYRKLMIVQDALRFPDFRYFIRVVEKGGKERFSPVIGNDELVAEIMRRRPAGEKVWVNVFRQAPVHAYRAEYAAKLYLHCENSGNTDPSLEFGVKKGPGGRMLDGYAMFLTSKALGHNRIDVVSANYLWKLDEIEAETDSGRN